MGIIVNHLYRKLAIKRYDDNHIIHYFSYTDFVGLQARQISFKTPEGLTIKGYLYNDADWSKKDDLVVLCHGISGGHRSYMREIELLCRNGYQVLAYDNVGCWESEGKDIVGLTEAVNDLVACINFIDSTPELASRRLSLIGHSMGGYAVGNVCNFIKRPIHSITVISGFVSVEQLFTLCFGGQVKKYVKPLMRFEEKAHPNIAPSCSADALLKTNAKVLVIHSKDDPTVDMKAGLGYLQEHIPASETRIKYLIVDKKLHNPNYTEDAVSYLNETFVTYDKLCKNKTLKTFEQKKEYMDQKDWTRMTEQDPEVWEKILKNLS